MLASKPAETSHAHLSKDPSLPRSTQPMRLMLESGEDIKDNLKLDGKVAVVTGAARGIGRAVAVAFGGEGASMIGIDICGQVDPVRALNPQPSMIWRKRVK